MSVKIDCVHAVYHQEGVGSQSQEFSHWKCLAKNCIAITNPPFGLFNLVPTRTGQIIGWRYSEHGFICKTKTLTPIHEELHPCDGCPLYKTKCGT